MRRRSGSAQIEQAARDRLTAQRLQEVALGVVPAAAAGLEGVDVAELHWHVLSLLGGARQVFRTHEREEQAADCSAAMGLSEKALGLLDDAVRDLGEAVASFRTASSHPENLAIAEIQLADVKVQLEQFDDADGLFDSAARHFDALGRSSEAAHARMARARAMLAAGAPDDVVERHLDAATHGLGDDVTPLDAAELDYHRGMVRAHLGDQEAAELLLRRAYDATRYAGAAALEAEVGTNLAAVVQTRGQLDEAEDILDRSLTLVRGTPLLEARVSQNLAAVRLDRGDADTAIALLEQARRTFERVGVLDEVAQCEVLLGAAHRDRGDPEAATAAIAHARDDFAENDANWLHAAMCEVLLGNLALLDGSGLNPPDLPSGAPTGWRDLDAALARVLAALSTVDQRRYELSSTGDRARWGAGWLATVFDSSLRLAQRLGRSATVAELIESARVQGVPVASADDAAALFRPKSGDRSQLASATRSEPRAALAPMNGPEVAAAWLGDFQPLSGPPPVSVGGRSALGEARDRADRALRIESATEVLGGADAWWWGSWRSGDALYWCLVRQGANPLSGAIDASAGSPLAEAMVRFGKAIGAPSQDVVAAYQDDPARLEALRTRLVKQGALWANPRAESRLAADLGRLLIPEPLRTEAERRAAAGGEPLRVVCAPAWPVARVPFGLLGIAERADVHGPAALVRLVEGAVVTMAPSVGFAAAVSEGIETQSQAPRPRLAAVLDPTRELAGAARLGDGWEQVFSGETATRDRLAESLDGVAPGSPGVFAYQGHITSGSRDRPSDAAFVLAGPRGEVDHVRAAEFFAPGRPPPWPVPSHVYLGGCDSTGAATGEEWLSLATALLWAGASTVISCLWRVADQAGAAFDPEMIDCLVEADDVAVAVRNRQLQHLDRWRSRDARPLPPYVWAIPAVMTVHRPE